MQRYYCHELLHRVGPAQPGRQNSGICNTFWRGCAQLVYTAPPARDIPCRSASPFQLVLRLHVQCTLTGYHRLHVPKAAGKRHKLGPPHLTDKLPASVWQAKQ
eukprot:3926162-Amphidinium_carterae.1